MTKSKIAKNTILLYFRMVIVMIVNLFTVRLLYLALGNSNYGIFNVIFGFVIIFQSVSSVLATSTQRFFAFSIGRKEFNEIPKIYTSSIIIYSYLTVAILLIAETVGLWFLNNYLNFPQDCIVCANILYQFSILTFIFTIFQSPFVSVILACEDINIYAVITLCDTFLKLLGTSLLFVIPFKRLEIYGIILMIISFIILSAYIIVLQKRYPICKFKKHSDRSLYKQMLSFSGWHLFSSLASVGMVQINTILVNIFFGVIVNAARAIALQINSAIISFTSSFITALRPPMIKAYADGDYLTLNKLFELSNKTIFYLLLIVLLPIYLTMNEVLTIWLGKVDDMTVLFSRLIVIYSIILALNNPISIIVQATGNVKLYFSLVEIFTLLCPVFTYIAFKFGAPPQATFYIMIVAVILSHLMRILCLKKIYNSFQILKYLKTFLLPGFLVCLISYCLVRTLFLFEVNIVFFYLLSFVIIGSLIYLVGLSHGDKQLLKSIIFKRIRHNG